MKSSLFLQSVSAGWVIGIIASLEFSLGVWAGPAPVVSIRANVGETVEPGPAVRVRPGEFTLQRRGSGAEALILFLEYGGTATAGQDFGALSQVFWMPGGESNLVVYVQPIDDALEEGDETVVARLVLPPVDTLPQYDIDPEHGEARVVIHDNEPAGVPRLEIVEPVEGQQFAPGDVVPLRARVVGDNLDRRWDVAFFDGERSIGTTRDGGTLWWTEAGGGPHVLSARTVDPATGTELRAAPVTILVGPGPVLPVVQVFAESWKTGEPCPTCFIAPAVLVFRRTGSAAEPLTLFLEVDGTAAAGSDYEPLPDRLTLPAGTQELRVNLLPLDDRVPEGPEILRVKLIHPTTDAAPTYLIASQAGAALVVIMDDESGAPRARLDLVAPEAGAQLPAHTAIAVTALGVDAEGEIDLGVEFLAGDQPIGRTEPLGVLRPTIPGLPSVHSILWTNPVPGLHALTGRALRPGGDILVSPAISVTVLPPPSTTLVSITAEDSVATEIDVTAAINPARFKVDRSGDLDHDLLVFYSVHGSAKSGVDYPELPGSIHLAKGEASATIEIRALVDDRREGMETIYLRLEPSPLAGPLPTYELMAARDAVAIILDGLVEPDPAVEIIWPEDGAVFDRPARVDLVAAAFHPTRDMYRVDFYAGDTKVGDSWLIFDRMFSGGLVVHHFGWDNPPGGEHRLTARAYAGEDHTLPTATSGPVPITVRPVPELPVVRIEATQPIAEESSAPLRRLPLVGEFTISRTGPTDESMTVFIHYSGMARPGVDYPALPWVVTLPAGAASTSLRVEPIPDEHAEGLETLVAAISYCPPDTDPPLGMPCVSWFAIDPAGEQATVFLRDDGITEASVAITRPLEGARFEAGVPIAIEGVAIDLAGYLSRVEFWDGDQRIGVSEIVFVRAPDPGTPIHHGIEWRDASLGSHTLTARTVRADGTALASAAVQVTVGSSVNQAPRIVIGQPTAGAPFDLGAPIEIVAEVTDPDGYVGRVEFFADGRKLGEQRQVFIRPPDPGQRQQFAWVWRHAPPGTHQLTARAWDDQGKPGESAAVPIQVIAPDLLPVVRVVTRDPLAVEPTLNAHLNTATFRVRRFGSTNQSLAVAYTLHGTGEHGVDYERLSGWAVIPAGQRSVEVEVRPLRDDLTEHFETVVLRLEDPPTAGPTPADPVPAYQVDFPRRAVALIADHPPRLGDRTSCQRVADGVLFGCLDAETGHGFRVEGSSDLRNWETVCEGVAIDGAVAFVDETAGSWTQRFFRLSPDPASAVAD